MSRNLDVLDTRPGGGLAQGSFRIGAYLNLDPSFTLPPLPPWENADAFPERPAASDYGYLSGEKFINCSQEELVRKCSRLQLAEVQLVGWPGASRLVTVFEVPFLFDSIIKKMRWKQYMAMASGTLVSLFLGSLYLGARRSSDPSAESGSAILNILLMLLFVFGATPIYRAFRQLQLIRTWTPAVLPRYAASARYSAWISSRPLFATWFIMSCVVGVYLCQSLLPLEDPIAAAGLVKDAIWRGEIWRLVTGPLLHGNILHIAINGMALIGLGRLTESFASRAHMSVAFLASCLGGSLMSLLLLPGTTSVGASGGLMGLIGFMGVLGLRRRDLLPPGFAKSIGINILLMAIIGIIAREVIDNAAHLGGLVSGVLCGFVLIKKEPESLPLTPSRFLQALGFVSLAILAVFALLAGWKMA